MKIPVVNEQDEIIGYKERGDLTSEDIWRISVIWAFNSKKEFLISKRHASKNIFPNRWGSAVAGTVEEDETYEVNAEKELEEELGLKNVKMIPYKKIYYKIGEAHRFCFIYVVFTDVSVSELVLQEDEVSEVKWIKLEDLYSWHKKSPDDFVSSFGNTLNLIKEYLNENQIIK